MNEKIRAALRLRIMTGTQEEAMAAYEELMMRHMEEYEGGEDDGDQVEKRR